MPNRASRDISDKERAAQGDDNYYEHTQTPGSTIHPT